jgi:CHAT domain-containing protein/tetratricopeptide (TPR) repeat protein
MTLPGFLLRFKLIVSSIAVIVLLTVATVAQDRSLQPNRPVEREIRRGQTQSYQIDLHRGQYLHVVAKQKDVDIKLRLHDPRGKMLVEIDAANYALDYIFELSPVTQFISASENETLSFQAPLSGRYRLDVLPVRSGATAGTYQLKIENLRSITTRDQKSIAAQNAFAEAEKLRTQATSEALRKAIEKYKEALDLWRQANDRIGQSHTYDKLAVAAFNLDQKEQTIAWLEQSLRLWQEASAQREVGHLLGNIAQVYELQRDLKAVDLATQELKLWQAVGDKKLEVLAQLRCSFFHSRLTRDKRKAESHFDEASVLSRAIEDKRLEACIRIFLGWGHDLSNGKRTALDYLTESLELCRAADDPICEGRTLIGLGDTYQFLGQHQQALDSYDLVLRMAPKWADHLGEIFALIHKGEVFFYQSNYQKAIDCYRQGLNVSQASNNHWGEGYALYNLGRVHELLGETEQAFEHYEQSLPHWRIIGDYDGVAYTINQIALLLEANGQKERVLKLLNEALELMRYMRDSYGEARTLDNIGMVYASRRETQKALEFFNHALPLRRSQQDASGEARTLSNIGLAYNQLGKSDEALDYLSQALKRYQSSGNRGGEADMHYRIACLKRGQGDENAARTEIEQTLSIVESLRAGVFNRNLRDSYFASIQTYYEFHIDLLMALHKKQPSEVLDRVALDTVERARARGMLELLTESRADIRQGIDQSLLDRELLIRQQLLEKEQSRMRLFGGNANPQQLETVDKEISSFVSQYEQIEAEIKAKSPRYAAVAQPKPLTVEQIQQRLIDPDTVLLEYALGEDRSFLWVVTQTSVHSYELPKRSDIDGAVRKLYDVMTARQTKRKESQSQYLTRVQEADATFERNAAMLSQILLGPVSHLLGTKRLLVIPDGSLAYLSFAALPNPTNSDKQLVASNEIVYLPSASTLAVLREQVERRSAGEETLAVLADPVFDKHDDRIRSASMVSAKTNHKSANAEVTEQALRDAGLLEEGVPLARLPFSRQEAEWISALIPSSNTLKAVGFNANLHTATSGELSRYRIVHFATHGLINAKRPYLSGLLLSLVDEHGRPQDGFLSLSQIYNLNLPADLVVLSACQTAMGKEVKGEGIIGLTRAFMYAGTPRVLASLWKVDDAATAELVKLFYTAMLKHNLPPSAALRSAQLEMSKHKLWQSPYYWAGFILQGEPN